MKNINYCVQLVRLDLDEFTTSRFQKMLQYGILGYRDLELTTEPKVKVLYATPNDAMIVPLPADWEYYTKIGMNIGGQVFTLTLNPNMAFTRRKDCGTEIAEVIASCSCQAGEQINYGYNFVSHFRNGQYVGEMYGRGGGTNALGYFRIDEEYRQIQFSNVPRTEYYIEYVSSGANDGSSLIPASAAQTLRAYIHWQLIEHRSDVHPNEKERKKEQYEKALYEYRLIKFTPTLDDFLDMTYRGIKSVVKR